jgi:hypothetical protein
MSDVTRIKDYYKTCHDLLAGKDPITLPNYRAITFKEAEDIAEFVRKGDPRRAKILFMSHVFLNDVRAALAYHYKACTPLSDLYLVIESATLALFQENYIAAYLTLMPVIEGTILRWMGFNPANTKPPFADVKAFLAAKLPEVRKKIETANASDNLKEVALAQAEYLEAVIKTHLFEQHLKRISDFNRHLAGHLIGKPEYCNSFNLATLFVLFDNLVDMILWDIGQYGPTWSEEFSDKRREARRMYNMFFEAARTAPPPHFRLARDINAQNQDYFARWFAELE